MSTVQKTWFGFKQFFWTTHQELRKTTDLTIQDAGMHHMNMVSDVSLVLQEVLHQEKSLTETLPGISEPTENVSNMVQNTQQ